MSDKWMNIWQNHERSAEYNDQNSLEPLIHEYHP